LLFAQAGAQGISKGYKLGFSQAITALKESGEKTKIDQLCSLAIKFADQLLDKK
jgi:hypothetical protein